MDTARPPSGTQLLVGYLAAFGSILSSVASASCVQALRGAIPDFQLSAIRSTMQGLTYTIGGLTVATDFTVNREYVAGLIYCGAMYLFYNAGFYGAATYLPLAEVQGIVTSVGFVFALAQSKLLFNMDIAKSIIIAASVCVVGIVLVVQPAWMFDKMLPTSNHASMAFNNASSTLQPLNTSMNYGYILSESQVKLGYMLSILGGAAMGVGFDINGIILHNVKIIPKATYTMLACTLGSVVFMFYFEDPVYVIDLTQFGFIVGHSMLSAIVSFLHIYASSIVPGPTMSILYSLEMVTMLMSENTIMHSIKPGNNNWIEVFGCIIIVFGASIPGVIDILAHKGKDN